MSGCKRERDEVEATATEVEATATDIYDGEQWLRERLVELERQSGDIEGQQRGLIERAEVAEGRNVVLEREVQDLTMQKAQLTNEVATLKDRFRRQRGNVEQPPRRRRRGDPKRSPPSAADVIDEDDPRYALSASLKKTGLWRTKNGAASFASRWREAWNYDLAEAGLPLLRVGLDRVPISRAQFRVVLHALAQFGRQERGRSRAQIKALLDDETLLLACLVRAD